MNKLYAELEASIINTYTNGVSLDEAERLAGKFLAAQLQVSNDLKIADLDARMRKTGVKAVKAAVYTNAIASSEKKPTEGQLEHTINASPQVKKEQEALDIAEASKEELERYYDIFQQAHVYYRQISRGVQG